MARDSKRIFISYFSSADGESHTWAKQTYDKLRPLLPGDYRIFKDRQNLDFGDEWPDRLEQELKQSGFFIVIITRKWSSPEIQKRLSDESCWVRREILAAVDSGSRIIPLCANGAKLPPLPEEFAPAIEKRHTIRFSRRDEEWDEGYKRLSRSITESWNESASKRIADDGYFLPLDRTTESSHVRSVVKGGRRVMAICADDLDSPLVFARRCLRDVANDQDIEAGASEPIEMDWLNFVDNPDPEQRKTDLLKRIAAELGLQERAGDLRQGLLDYLSRNREMRVFHLSIPNSRRAIPERMLEWLDIWHDLLQESRATTTLAILYFPRSRFLTRRPRLGLDACEQQKRLQKQGLGRVQRDHVQAFIRHLEREGLEREQQKRLKRLQASLFRFPTGQRFQTLMDAFRAELER